MINLTKTLQYLLKELKHKGRGRFASDAFGSFLLKIVSNALALVTSLILTRILGASAYGTYAYAMSWVALITVPCLLGMDRLLIRQVAIYKAQYNWHLMRGILYWSNSIVFAVSTGAAFVIALIAFLTQDQIDIQTPSTLCLAMVLVPITAMTRLRQSALHGLRCIVWAQYPELLIRPLLFAVTLVGVYIFVTPSIDVTQVIIFQILSAAVAFFFGVDQLRRKLRDIGKSIIWSTESRAWLRSALPLVFIGTAQVISNQTDIILLGSIRGSHDVGVYAIAKRGADLISFFLIAMNVSVAPAIADFYSNGETSRLQNFITRSVRINALISVIIGLFLILFGRIFLSLFGLAFTDGQTALIILSFGYILNSVMGTVGILLIMTGNELDAGVCIALSTVLNILLNALLIYYWGLEGAALAVSVTLLFSSTIMTFRAHQKLGINCTVFAGLGS